MGNITRAEADALSIADLYYYFIKAAREAYNEQNNHMSEEPHDVTKEENNSEVIGKCTLIFGVCKGQTIAFLVTYVNNATMVVTNMESGRCVATFAFDDVMRTWAGVKAAEIEDFDNDEFDYIKISDILKEVILPLRTHLGLDRQVSENV